MPTLATALMDTLLLVLNRCEGRESTRPSHCRQLSVERLSVALWSSVGWISAFRPPPAVNTLQQQFGAVVRRRREAAGLS
jgi:hypothetical protein